VFNRYDILSYIYNRENISLPEVIARAYRVLEPIGSHGKE